MLKMNIGELCGNCRFWRYLGEGETNLGECHRNAPVPVPEDTAGSLAVTWPNTSSTDWCGEYKP